METKFSGNRIQVIEPQLDPLTVIKKIVHDGQEDCFYVCDISDIVQKHRNWKIAMPRVKTFYAVKCNDSRAVLETLAALGTGFDCASKDEIDTILSLGVQPERIVYANPTKKPNHIRYAAEVGVTHLTFDNEAELYKMKKCYPEADLVLRIRYDDPSALFVLGQKFGADPKTEAKGLLTLASSLKLNVVGVSFHIGSGSKTFGIYSKAIAAAKKVFDMGTNIGFKMRLLDIGGGFPGEKNGCIAEIGENINKALAAYFPDPSVQIIAEPGRYYVDSAFTLATNIHSYKTIKSGTSTETNMYYVDTGVYGALLCTAFGDSYHPQPLFEDLKSPIYPSIIWGATCDSCDKICENVELPRMEMGDWIVFQKAGAYTVTLACEFNSFPTPSVHSIINTEDWIYLTQKLSRPVPKNRFTKGNTVEHFRTGLDFPFTTKYF